VAECVKCELLRGDVAAAIADINFMLIQHLDLSASDVEFLSGAEAIVRDA
jgi:hypothetical protein